MEGEKRNELDATVFKELVEQSPGGVCLFDEERFFYVNQALADAFGYRPEEVIGRLGSLDPVHPEDRPLVQENIRRQLRWEEESVSYEFRGLRKDGTSAWYQVLGHRVEYQGRPAIIGTLVDITERMRAEKELRESEERYRRLFEDIPLGVYRTRPDGRILDMNHAGRKLFGFSEDGPLEGERIQDRYVHLEDRQRFHELIAHEGVVRDFEVQMRRRDGEIIWRAMMHVPSVTGQAALFFTKGRLMTSLPASEPKKISAPALRNLPRYWSCQPVCGKPNPAMRCCPSC